MATRKSPIKFKELQKEYSKLNIMSTYEIEDTNKVIKFYQRFDEAKVEELIKELYQDIQYVTDNNIDFFTNDEEFMKYELFLIIKHFSHFKDEIGDSFEEKIEALSVLISIGLYDLFFEEIFDSSEVFDVLHKVERTAELAIRTLDEQSKIIKDAQEQFVNKGVIQNALKK